MLDLWESTRYLRIRARRPGIFRSRLRQRPGCGLRIQSPTRPDLISIPLSHSLRPNLPHDASVAHELRLCSGAAARRQYRDFVGGPARPVLEPSRPGKSWSWSPRTATSDSVQFPRQYSVLLGWKGWPDQSGDLFRLHSRVRQRKSIDTLV